MLRGDAKATDLFEFLAHNTKVEWSQTKFGIDRNYISTSHLPGGEAGGPVLLRNLVMYRYTVRESIHSHPWNPRPSNGDVRFAGQVNEHAPHVLPLLIYHVPTRTYIYYNHRGEYWTK